MTMVRRMKISKGGQISVPADVRSRWGSSTVVIDDRGDHLVVRPAADDPVEASFGVFAEDFRDAPPADQLIRDLRDADAESSERRTRPPGQA
jgi:bifunctional DNA-binding transcriptional regulator/antitoxin component of YhaV-PrlF toxin-antitoxin module